MYEWQNVARKPTVSNKYSSLSSSANHADTEITNSSKKLISNSKISKPNRNKKVQKHFTRTQFQYNSKFYWQNPESKQRNGVSPKSPIVLRDSIIKHVSLTDGKVKTFGDQQSTGYALS